MELASIVSLHISFRKEIGLELGVVSSEHFNVNLVQVVTLKVERRHYTLALGRLHHHFYLSKHDIKAGFERRVIKPLLNAESEPITSERSLVLGFYDGKVLGTFSEILLY